MTIRINKIKWMTTAIPSSVSYFTFIGAYMKLLWLRNEGAVKSLATARRNHKFLLLLFSLHCVMMFCVSCLWFFGFFDCRQEGCMDTYRLWNNCTCVQISAWWMDLLITGFIVTWLDTTFCLGGVISPFLAQITNPIFPLKERKAAALVATLILHGLHAIIYGLGRFFTFSSFISRHIKKIRES